MSKSTETIDRVVCRFMRHMTVEFKPDGTIEVSCMFVNGIAGKNFPSFEAMVDGLAKMLEGQEQIANERTS